MWVRDWSLNDRVDGTRVCMVEPPGALGRWGISGRRTVGRSDWWRGWDFGTGGSPALSTGSASGASAIRFIMFSGDRDTDLIN